MAQPWHPLLSQGKAPTQGRTILVGCSVLSMAFPLLMGLGDRSWMILHYTVVLLGGLSHVPNLLLQPCLSHSSVQGGGEAGRRHRAGGMSPVFPHPTLPSVLMIWFNLFCFLS